MHKMHSSFNKSEFHAREESLTHDLAPSIDLHAIYRGACQQANAKNGKTKHWKYSTASRTSVLMS